MSSNTTAPFQSPSGDFDPALLLLNLRNKDESESADEMRRTSSQSSSGPTSQNAQENEEFASSNYTRESSLALLDTCTCKKSKCLKKYCQCFATNAICGQHCRCVECENTSYDNIHRKRAIEELLIRNPAAFVPKIKIDTAITEDADLIQQTSHRVGCRCRKSMCLKKYCECYQGGVLCSTICTCLECRNKGDGTGTEESIANSDAQMDMEMAMIKAKIIKKQTSFTRKRPLSFLEEESPNLSSYDAAKFFPDDASSLQAPAFATSALAGIGALSSSSLLSASLLKHALASSAITSSSASSTLMRNHTFPLRPVMTETDQRHHQASIPPTQQPDLKRMKSLSALESNSVSLTNAAATSTPVSNKTPLSMTESAHTSRADTTTTSNSSVGNMETPRNNSNVSPQSWSIAQAFYRLGDEFASAAKKKALNQSNSSSNNGLLLTDEQRKAIRLSMSSSISTEGREAIAESVLRTLRFSAENFFQQFSESGLEEDTAQSLPHAQAIVDSESSSSKNDLSTMMDVDYQATEEGATIKRTRALSETDSKKENADPRSKSSSREIETVFKSSPFVKAPSTLQHMKKAHLSQSQDKSKEVTRSEEDSETEAEASDREKAEESDDQEDDNEYEGEGDERERRYLKKMAAKQRAVQAALDAAASASIAAQIC